MYFKLLLHELNVALINQTSAVIWKAPGLYIESLPLPLREYLTATDYQIMKSNMM